MATRPRMVVVPTERFVAWRRLLQKPTGKLRHDNFFITAEMATHPNP